MDSVNGNLTFPEVQSALFAAKPEVCRPCHSRDLRIMHLAEKVMRDETTLQEAIGTVQVDLETNCRLGAVARGGCFGGVRCQYGIARN